MPPPLQGNHIYTSGSIGTNAAVIKGALRASMPEKLTVILPQSLKRQPAESQELLQQVGGGAGGTEGVTLCVLAVIPRNIYKDLTDPKLPVEVKDMLLVLLHG